MVKLFKCTQHLPSIPRTISSLSERTNPCLAQYWPSCCFLRFQITYTTGNTNSEGVRLGTCFADSPITWKIQSNQDQLKFSRFKRDEREMK